MRISDRVLADTVRNDLNTNLTNLTQIEQILSSGKRISVPSDDPAGTASVLRYSNDIDQNDQYARTAGAGKARLSAADTAMGSLTDVMQRVRELTVQAGSGSLSQSELTAIGTELNQLLGQAVQIGNTKVGDQYIFAGTMSTTLPFTTAGAVPPAVTFNGNSNVISLPTGQGTSTQVNVDGNQAFMPAMNAIIQIRNAVNSGQGINGVQTALNTIDTAIDGLLQQRGTVGATVDGLDSLTSRIDTEQTDFKAQRSNLQDADIADTVVKLNTAQNVYQASLGAAAKAIQPSLVEFLR